MASTPPAQIQREARTPPTPLHGSAYHSNPSPSRYNTRSSKRSTSDSVNSSFTQSAQSPQSSRTPRSPPQNLHLDLHSPDVTPRRKVTRRVQVLSPTSPDSVSEPFAPSHPQNKSYLSTATILSEGMLPTPVKTPKKKQVLKSTMAARVLFQDQPHSAQSSPRKPQRKRHNGFSLEVESAPNAEVAIFTDSRDQIPQIDNSPSNPFYPSSKSRKRTASSRDEPVAQAGPSKRRKTTKAEARKIDPQVEEAIERDEGMVYVFRGKKVYRRFEDAGDEEEVIDPEELDLLGRQYGSRENGQTLKTLTRKSIRPRRLFQEEKQPSQSDEEAETEIEDNQEVSNGQENPDDVPASPSRATRSQMKKVANSETNKKGSPFDSWRRLKAGSRSSSVKDRKRTAAEALEV